MKSLNTSLQHPTLPINLASSLLLLVGVTISLAYWSKRKALSESRLFIAFAGLTGAFIGAKLAYFVAEALIWWDDPAFWVRMFAGKTILGGLLGGWAGVELGKWLLGETRVMGDEFAQIIPIGILIGRVGCWLHGCCPGRPIGRVLENDWATWCESMGVVLWPAPLVEIAFQLAFLACSRIATRLRWFRGQHFHLYLIAYGIFRYLHEPLRATVRYPHTDMSPYMVLSGFVALSGLVAFAWRAYRQQTTRLSNSIS